MVAVRRWGWSRGDGWLALEEPAGCVGVGGGEREEDKEEEEWRRRRRHW